jgi:hypothetical protein
MLVFIDESGDPGLKPDSGSSDYFIVTLVVFEDNDEALATDHRIECLKKELSQMKMASALSFRNAHHTVTVRAEAVSKATVTRRAGTSMPNRIRIRESPRLARGIPRRLESLPLAFGHFAPSEAVFALLGRVETGLIPALVLG